MGGIDRRQEYHSWDETGYRRGAGSEIITKTNDMRQIVRFDKPIEGYLPHIGVMPLPPYIHDKLTDPERYQTIYSKETGSAAAPTAGLHFTDRTFSNLRNAGIDFTEVVLHVGLDTFAPITEDEPEKHKIHTEWCQISKESAAKINQAKNEGRRVIAVGTTTVRTLETGIQFAQKGEWVGEMSGSTGLFIMPGYSFRIIDGMITNFHLPKSSLLMLVSSFIGREKVLDLYSCAIQERYRFYSFGDAMLIV